jgi:hypothetical protein
MAAGLGNVLRRRVVDPDAEAPEHTDGWPEPRPEERTKQARPMEGPECATQQGSAVVW